MASNNKEKARKLERKMQREAKMSRMFDNFDRAKPKNKKVREGYVASGQDYTVEA
jgi:hypothetical protein